MADSIKAINPIITIQPLASAVTNRDATGTQNILALLSDGSIVRGFVINRDSSGRPILRTPQGDFAVNSEVFIKTGSEVALKVDSSQPSFARILTIDNLSPEEYSAHTTRGLTADTITPPSLGSTLATPLVTGQPATAAQPVLQALVLQATPATPQGTAAQMPANPQAAPLPTALLQLPPGTPVTLTIVDVKLPPLPISLSAIPETSSLASLLAPAAPPATVASSTTQQLAILTNALLATPSGNAPTAPAPLATPVPMPATSVPASTPPPQPAPLSPYISALPPTLVAAQHPSPPAPSFLGMATYPQSPAHGYAAVASYVPPFAASAKPILPPAPLPANTATAQLPASSANASLPPLPATVIGHAEDGANILHTDFATLKLFTAQPLPTGTVLTIKPEVLAAATAVISTFSDIPAPTTPAAVNFGDMAAALAQWAATNPAMMRAMTAQMPMIGSKFTSGLLYFIAAVKSGNIRDAFNARALQLLATEKPELLAKLTRDIATLQQQFADSPLNEWKPLTIPFIFGSEVTPAQLYVRREGGDGNSASSAGQLGQRFLLDIGFSELGQMQFDGFVRVEPKLKSLELFVRSQEQLDGSHYDAIRGIFDTATGATGMTGQVVFQHGLDRFVRPQPKAASVSHAHGAHTILA